MKVEKHSPRWLLEKILDNANHPAKALLYIIEFQNELVKNNCDLPVVINRLDFKEIESLVQQIHFEDSDYGNDEKRCAELIEKTRNKIGYTSKDVQAYL